MLPIIRAKTPELLKLARDYEYADIQVNNASTHLTKTAFVMEKVASGEKLVDIAVKLGSEVLKSLKAIGLEDELKKVKKKKVKEASISVPKALGLGAVATIPAALAANHFINKASDEIDSKMIAIPGLAAATIAAVLAAKNSGLEGTKTTKKEAALVAELHSALESREVIKTAMDNSSSNVSSDLEKLSHLNREHVAILLKSILA